MHSPWDFPDMEKAVKRIKKAIDKKERIMIFGDYDADGITGTAILVRALRELGAQVSYRLPHRENDGYGLSMKFIEEFVDLSVKLIITVDCGIACPEEVKRAKEAGIDTIITDHHDIPLKPAKAYAILHTKTDYPFSHLAGAGVAYKLAEALLGEKAQNYIDLAAIGTIADIVPLIGENRAIAKAGLQKLAKTEWPGLRALKRNAQIYDQDLLELDSDLIGYRIGPRINAAGRIDTPYLAAQLLISDEKNISDLAMQIENLNKQRQELVKDVLTDLSYDEDSKIIFVIGEWPKGILGLIAGRISEQSGRPVIAMAEKDGVLTGSARSHEYFHITEALKELDEILEEYGGHRKAAGLSLKRENADILQRELKSMMNAVKIPPKKLKIDCEITPQELSQSFLQALDALKPFGEGNEPPVFLMKNIEIIDIKMVGTEENHMKLSCKFGNKQISGIKFNAKNEIPRELTKRANIAGKLKKDSYAKTGYSLLISDVEPC